MEETMALAKQIGRGSAAIHSAKQSMFLSSTTSAMPTIGVELEAEEELKDVITERMLSLDPIKR
jgi:hypothetical protein